jgi:tripartite-type tricarboxylate transporter receptor subunit TctC
VNLPVRNVADLIAQAKAQPNKFAYASVGNGSPGHLAGELTDIRMGTKMQHIPYRGGGPAVIDVIGGQVPLLWVSIPAAAQFVKSGKLKALAVSTARRSEAFPDVPTMQEAGVSDFEVDSWYAMLVPARTPRPIIDRLNRALNTVLQEPAVRAQLIEQGAEAVGGTPEDLGRVIAAELPKWAKLAREAGIKAD